MLTHPTVTESHIRTLITGAFFLLTLVVPMLVGAASTVMPAAPSASSGMVASDDTPDNWVVFPSRPTLTPDGQTIIFSYEGDLWQVPRRGGQAARITAMNGVESHPVVSPDGRWLAFSSTIYGNSDVFITELAGGEIRQLTWHQGSDFPESWSWDSQTLYFNSNRENRGSTWQIAVGGGTPSRIFSHYHNAEHNLAIHPDGRFFFNETGESSGQAHRKRYRGANAPHIASFAPATAQYIRHTTWDGKNMWPTIDRHGNIYYTSDEANGQYNIYRLTGPDHFERDLGRNSAEGDTTAQSGGTSGGGNSSGGGTSGGGNSSGGTSGGGNSSGGSSGSSSVVNESGGTSGSGNPTPLTQFDTSVRHISVSASGDYIVFERDYAIWVYDVYNKTSFKPAISVVNHTPLTRDQDFRVQGNITNFDVSPDKKKLAFVSRGELFISDADGKFVRQLTTDPMGRVSEVKWLSDNKTLLFTQTGSGYQNVFTIAAEGSAPARQHTRDLQNNRTISLSPDRTKAVYVSGRGEVRVMNLATFASETVVRDEIWDVFSSAPSFSPDGRYLLYSVMRNFEQNIHVYDLTARRVIPITDTGVSESDPVWSPDGRYIYFQTNRTRPAYPYGMQDSDIWRIALNRVTPEFRSDRVDALFAPAEEAGAVTVRIHEEGLRQRWEQVGTTFGNQTSPFVVHKDGKTSILYRSNHDQGRNAWWKTVQEAFESDKTEKIPGTELGAGPILIVDGSVYALLGGDIHTVNIDAPSVKKIDIQHTFRRNIRSEFTQMFDEAWANLETNFYNDDFHGIDWAAVREQYRVYLPLVRTRADFRTMMNDMFGELNTSHIGFSSSGDEENTFFGTNTMSTGIVFDSANPYRVARLVAKSTAEASGSDIRAGDELIAVNGVRVDPSQNRERYFSAPSSDRELELTFQRGRETVRVKLQPESWFTTRNHLYDEWQQSRRAEVDTRSEGRIAYVHMKNMGTGELEVFLREMAAYGNSHDGLILDLRHNTGGNVHDAVLQFLSQRHYLNWGYREGALGTQPHFVPGSKPIVLLINEASLSDAEMTAAGFKQLGLGTIIGVETYRWIIFTSGRGLVDGSFYRLPSWGVYGLGGENLELTGVAPDIHVVESFADRLIGRDPQLERAIEHIRGQW